MFVSVCVCVCVCAGAALNELFINLILNHSPAMSTVCRLFVVAAMVVLGTAPVVSE